MIECNSSKKKPTFLDFQKQQPMTTKVTDIENFLEEAQKHHDKLYLIVCTYHSSEKVNKRVGKQSMSVFDETHFVRVLETKRQPRHCRSVRVE